MFPTRWVPENRGSELEMVRGPRILPPTAAQNSYYRRSKDTLMGGYPYEDNYHNIGQGVSPYRGKTSQGDYSVNQQAGAYDGLPGSDDRGPPDLGTVKTRGGMLDLYAKKGNRDLGATYVYPLESRIPVKYRTYGVRGEYDWGAIERSCTGAEGEPRECSYWIA